MCLADCNTGLLLCKVGVCFQNLIFKCSENFVRGGDFSKANGDRFSSVGVNLAVTESAYHSLDQLGCPLEELFFQEVKSSLI